MAQFEAKSGQREQAKKRRKAAPSNRKHSQRSASTRKSSHAARPSRPARSSRTATSSRSMDTSTTSSRLSPGVRTGLLLSLIIVLAMIGIFVFSNIQQVKTLVAQQNNDARLYSFNPGYIISDNLFFNEKAMTQEQVAAFLTTQGEACQGEWCLKNHRFEVHSEKKDELCAAYTPEKASQASSSSAANSANSSSSQGSPGSPRAPHSSQRSGSSSSQGSPDSPSSPSATAAEIIMAAASSCHINPRVLLVLLQKESGAVTMRNPSEKNYRYAMGLNCPDNAECDRRYAGFFNQVFGAARRFQYYRANPGQYQFSAQHVNSIAFNPNAACGANKVYIENTATALLYIYTPYQPNRAALAGKPDSCSSFGNLNFARLWEQWFGARQ